MLKAPSYFSYSFLKILNESRQLTQRLAAETLGHRDRARLGGEGDHHV